MQRIVELEADEIADVLHDALLRELAVLAPTGSDRTMPVTAVADALCTLLASVLIAAQPGMPANADEVERQTKLFRRRLEEALVAGAGCSGPIGHA